MTDSKRSIAVDENLVRRMARDASVYSLTRPLAIVMWVTLLAALVLGFVTIGAVTAAGGEVSPTLAWTPVLVVLLLGMAVLVTVSSARRALRAAIPPGTRVYAEIGAESLHLGSTQGTSDILYTAFRDMRAGRDAVMLRLKSGSVATAVPRALLTDADIEHIRSKIG